jgi:hypothetical protein
LVNIWILPTLSSKDMGNFFSSYRWFFYGILNRISSGQDQSHSFSVLVQLCAILVFPPKFGPVPECFMSPELSSQNSLTYKTLCSSLFTFHKLSTIFYVSGIFL